MNCSLCEYEMYFIEYDCYWFKSLLSDNRIAMLNYFDFYFPAK